MYPSQQQLGEYLENLARTGTLTTYTELHKYFNVPMPRHGEKCELQDLVHKLCQEDIKARRPLRAATIVLKRKHGSPVPSGGFFKVFCAYRQCPIPTTLNEKRKLHAEELEALREYYH